MIQSVLVFLLGFLCAAFLVLLIAPLLWQRAHFLWQKQMAARLPLSLTAIEADRDLLRASHAVELRKAEMQTSLMREKHTQALLKISADRSELEKLPPLQQELEVLHIQQQNVSQQLSSVKAELKTLQQQKQTDIEERGRLHRQNEALSQLSDTLRLEAAARETEADRLRREANGLRQEKNLFNSAKSELASQVAALKTSLESEKHRSQALEDKLHRLITELSDTQEKLEHRSKHSLPDSTRQDQSLRDTISELAAEMVAKTAAAEGVNSPVHALLQQQQDSNQPNSDKENSQPKSLADRIKNRMA